MRARSRTRPPRPFIPAARRKPSWTCPLSRRNRKPDWVIRELIRINRKQRMLLGLVDHGTRWCVALKELGDKRALTIWRELLVLFRHHGIPKRIRVDNESSFNAGWLKLALRLLGVKIHTTAPFSPWQNGKIERLFKSFKEDFRKVVQGDLTLRLNEWRWFYNHARPHMGIDHRTPAEAWTGRSRASGEGIPVSLWDGALRAFWFPDG